MRRQRFIRLGAAVFSALCLAMGATALEPEGPRPGTVFELLVSVSSVEQLAAVQEAGYNVGAYDPIANTATVYATPAEREALETAGYAVVEVGRQPAPPDFGDTKVLGIYHSYAGVSTHLQDYASAYPAITQLSSLGESVQERQIWALLITDNPNIEEAEPEFKYVSTLHGDEPVGTELLLYLIDRLLTGYGVDSRVTDLVNETAIWVVPLANPDGLELGQRFNANGIDLNRSYPEFGGDFLGTHFDGEPLGAIGREPETRRLMEWAAANRFVLSANLHTGALVVNYPYDHTPGIPSGTDAPTPDYALMEALSLIYSTPNTPMFNSISFPDGITNGSDWFSITGGLQDWSYRYLGNIDATIELSVAKKPLESVLATLWADNEESMLAYMESVHMGIRGVVTDEATTQPVSAKIFVLGNPQPVFTDPQVGDYYRLLLPGTYDLFIEADGYFSETVENVVVTSGAATQVDVVLEHVPLPATSRLVFALTAASMILLGAWQTSRRVRRRLAR